MTRKSTVLLLEELESRCLLSLTVPVAIHASQPGIYNPTVTGFTPSQIRKAYQFDQIPFVNADYNHLAGQGQTIAIVDVFDHPNIASDLHVFDTTPGIDLPDPPSFLKVNQKGSTTGPFPKVDWQWAGEIALDVEWAHAIAPAANIVLVEASSTRLADLITAIDTARTWPGVTTVSMSWGYSEFSTEKNYDSHLTTPKNHPGVTFVAATLDNGAFYGSYWPATSPNVLAVGGTTLTLDSNNSWTNETGWRWGGGGISKYETRPDYQSGVVSSSYTKKANPDVSYDADPNTGFAVYDTVPYNGQTGWFDAGGTSAGTPQWAALVAIANQGRAVIANAALDGRNQVLPAIYQMARTSSSTYFHDITTGNNGFSAGLGFDLVTGIGTPLADQIVNNLVSYSSGAITTTSANSTGNGPSGTALAALETASSSTLGAAPLPRSYPLGEIGQALFLVPSGGIRQPMVELSSAGFSSETMPVQLVNGVSSLATERTASDYHKVIGKLFGQLAEEDILYIFGTHLRVLGVEPS